MAKSGKGRTRSSPPATALASKTTTTSSSSSTNPEETTSPYFLPDLIPLIASRLTTLQDFFALRATCRAYRARLPLSSSNLASQGPLLLVGHKTSADVIFNVPLRRILRFRLPHAPISHGRRSPTCFHRLFTPQVPTLTCFQSMGCRVAIRSVSASATRPELRVCHLLTGKRARLPDLPNRICGVLFSDDLVLAFMPWYRDIYYCRIGDAEWQAARCDEGYKLCSLVFVKGTLYALTSPNYRLAVVELENNSVVLSFLGDDLSAQMVPIMVASLAECHGEILLIILVRIGLYHVFQWQSRDRKWASTDSLGGCSLFFNMHEFAGCLGSDHPGVRRDCLYFTGNYGKWREYSLVDRSLHEIVVDYPGRAVGKDFVPLAWVLPSNF
ncbi:hypothetical protein ZWY2020_026762 [Hordeum vulgare]|nr:hypothetical protein ZWY2020_026762 [Hordeum vulgare]